MESSEVAPDPLCEDASRLEPSVTRPFELQQFKQKIPAPSLLMHPSDGFHYRCAWIEGSITIHSDGNVSCGLDDPYAQRSFGNINSQKISDIVKNPQYSYLRENLWNGRRCQNCHLYERETNQFDFLPAEKNMPHTIVIEPTIKCNINCLNSTCINNNDKNLSVRDGDMMAFDAFTWIIDQLQSDLKYVYFFNYGDPFVHSKAEDMLLYIRKACPASQIITSTNGIPLAKPGRALKVVQAEPNCIVFTIGGVTQESYGRYHVGGRCELALRGLKNVADAKKTSGNTNVKIVWRYLLFSWNDSEAEVEEAFRLSREFEVNDFWLYLTLEPLSGASFRFAPGTPNYEKYRNNIDCALGYNQYAGIAQADEAGFYAPEKSAELGPLRWTTWRARMNFDGRNRWIDISFTTSRPETGIKTSYVFLRTPWKTYKIPLCFMHWVDISIPVPKKYKAICNIEVYIIAPDYWFPVEETSVDDRRCLGVMVKHGDEIADLRARLSRWLRAARLPQPSAQDLAELSTFTFKATPALPPSTAGRTW